MWMYQVAMTSKIYVVVNTTILGNERLVLVAYVSNHMISLVCANDLQKTICSCKSIVVQIHKYRVCINICIYEYYVCVCINE